MWAVLYGVMQGLAVALLVPAVQALFDQNWGSFVRWLAAMAVCAVISSIAHYLQAMKGFESALTLLRTMHLRLGDHLVTLPLGWFGAGRLGQVSQVASKGTISVMGGRCAPDDTDHLRNCQPGNHCRVHVVLRLAARVGAGGQRSDSVRGSTILPRR